VARKRVFLTQKLILNQFFSKKPRKYRRNLVKSIYDLQKCKTTPPNLKLKNFLSFRYVQGKKKTYNSNPPHHMKHFDIKIDFLVAYIFPNDNFLSLSRNLATSSLSSTHKERKKKFGIKIYLFKIIGTNYPIAKKDSKK
jgi:hypothetical protein